MTDMEKKFTKTLILSLVMLVLSFTINMAYPSINRAVELYRNNFYDYQPAVESVLDVSGMPPARAVPILMYHGIVPRVDEDNTEIGQFIKQMEMLKSEGYETISLRELESFYKGRFVLPPKPIVITFDDGRIDSYYPTDEVFKKLGFRAVIFVASGKQEDKDRFFLSWDDLRVMRDSGRWEVEAHGEYSHEVILTDENETEGRFLTAFRYSPLTGLETKEAFERRVETDYINNIIELKKNLNITPRYYAIPLNDYGQQESTNNPEAPAFNSRIIKKYFKMAFVQANDPANVTDLHFNIYNYEDDDPYFTRRIEVKNMSVADLKAMLDDNFPGKPEFAWKYSDGPLKSRMANHFGDYQIAPEGMVMKTEGMIASVFLGDDHWKDYVVEADVQRTRGRSIAILGYIRNARNYVLTGITDNGMFLREFTDGEERNLAEPVIIGNRNGLNNFKMVFKGRSVDVYLNGQLMFDDIKISAEKGNFGFKVWDDKGEGEGLVKSFKIYPHDK